MTSMTTTQARKDFASVLKLARRGVRIRLDRHGKPVAAIVSADDLALLEAIQDRLDRRAARAALAEIERDGSIPADQVFAELDL